MISKSKQSIIITQPNKPIHLIKQLNISNPNSNSSSNDKVDTNYFLISSLDHKIIFIQVDHANTLAFRHAVLELENLVTAMYYGEQDGMVLLGCVNGDVVRAQVKVPETGELSLVKQDSTYKQKDPGQKSIVVLYTAKTSIIVFNLANQLRIIQQSTMNLLSTHQFQHDITAAIYFRLDPTRNMGCVSFNTGQPPTIFNCSSLQNFITTHKQTHKFYTKYQFSQHEITTISHTIHKNSAQKLVVCSSNDNNSNANLVVVYCCKYIGKYGLDYLEPVYKFEVKGAVLYLSVKERVCMVCLYNSLVFFEVQSRKSVLVIEKNDLEVTMGLVLRGGNEGVKFLAYKGFNFLQPHRFKQRQAKLIIRSKNYDESKSK